MNAALCLFEVVDALSIALVRCHRSLLGSAELEKCKPRFPSVFVSTKISEANLPPNSISRMNVCGTTALGAERSFTEKVKFESAKIASLAFWVLIGWLMPPL
jgi:hypothetical protein